MSIPEDGILVEYIPILRAYDTTNSTHRWAACLIAFIVDIAILVSICLLSLCFKTYMGLSTKYKVFWIQAAIRGVFGTQATILGVLIFLNDQPLWDDFATGRTISSELLVARIIGFFVFEVAVLAISDLTFSTFNKALLAHHSLSLICYFMAFHYESCHYLGMLAVILEVSTPFTSVSWMLIQAKQAKTAFWKGNQYLLVYLFNMRQFMLLAGLYNLWRHWSSYYAQVHHVSLFLFLFSFIVVAFTLNPYWLYKKTIQLATGEDWNMARKTAKGISKNVQTNGSSVINSTNDEQLDGNRTSITDGDDKKYK